MCDGEFGGSPMGSLTLCNHISNTTACTYQLNEIRPLSIHYGVEKALPLRGALVDREAKYP
jgi:hypothetical protein